MSIKMYAYLVAKTDWWKFVDQLNKFYWENPIMSALRQSLREGKDNKNFAVAALAELEELFNNKNMQVELQVFDYSSTHYLFRMLEAGYYFMNNCDKFEMVEMKFYDDRSDVPSEDLPNRSIVDEVDKMIADKHYFIYPIVTDSWGFDLWQEWREEKLKNKENRNA